MDHLKIPFSVTNQMDHPTRVGYVVFYYKTEAEADYFEEKLKEGNFFYERALQEDNKKHTHLFGIRVTDEEKVSILNFETIGKFRKPLIADPVTRYVVTGLGIVMLILAIVGAVKTM